MEGAERTFTYHEKELIDESGEQKYAFCFRCLREWRKPCQQ